LKKDEEEMDEVNINHTVIATYITVGMVGLFLIIFFIGSCFIKVHKVLDAYIDQQ